MYFVLKIIFCWILPNSQYGIQNRCDFNLLLSKEKLKLSLAFSHEFVTTMISDLKTTKLCQHHAYLSMIEFIGISTLNMFL